MRLLALLSVVFLSVSQADDGSMARDLARTAQDLFPHTERADHIWPAYQPSRRPLGVFEPGLGVLIRHCVDDLPDGWVRLADVVERPALGSCALFRPDSRGLGNAPFHIEWDFGTFSATVMRRDSFDMATLLHEDFHGFQASWPWKSTASTLASLDESADSAQFRASIEREGELLRQAWREDEEGRAKELLLRWLALRLNRDSVASDEFVVLSRRNEVIEGTATWLGHAAAETLTGRDGLMEHLGPILGQLGPAPRGLSNQVAFTYYGHGGLLAALLDRWWAGEDWTQRLESGESFPQLVQAMLDVDQTVLAARLEDELGQRSWRRSERSHARMLGRLERQRARATEFAWLLEFYLPHAEGVESPVFSFRSDNVQRDPGGPLIIGQAESFQLELGDISLRASGQTLVIETLEIDSDSSEAVTRVSIPLQAPLTTSGLTADGQFSAVRQFSDRSAQITMDANVPVQVRQVRIQSGD